MFAADRLDPAEAAKQHAAVGGKRISRLCGCATLKKSKISREKIFSFSNLHLDLFYKIQRPWWTATQLDPFHPLVVITVDFVLRT